MDIMDSFSVKDLSDYVVNKLNLLTKSRNHSGFFQQISLFNFRIKCEKKSANDPVKLLYDSHNQKCLGKNTINVIYDRNKLKSDKESLFNKFIAGVEEKTVWKIMSNSEKITDLCVANAETPLIIDRSVQMKTETPTKKKKIVMKHRRNIGTNSSKPMPHEVVSVRNTAVETEKVLKPIMKDEVIMTEVFKPKTVTRYTNTNPKRLETTYQVFSTQRNSSPSEEKPKKTVYLSRSVQVELIPNENNKTVATTEPAKPGKLKCSIANLFRRFRMKKCDKCMQSDSTLGNPNTYSRKVVCNSCGKKFTQKFIPYNTPNNNTIIVPAEKDEIAKDLSETLRLLIKMETKQNHKYLHDILNELCQQRNDINRVIDMYKQFLETQSTGKTKDNAALIKNSLKVIQAARKSPLEVSSLDVKLQKDVVNEIEKIKSKQDVPQCNENENSLAVRSKIKSLSKDVLATKSKSTKSRFNGNSCK